MQLQNPCINVMFVNLSMIKMRCLMVHEIWRCYYKTTEDIFKSKVPNQFHNPIGLSGNHHSRS